MTAYFSDISFAQPLFLYALIGILVLVAFYAFILRQRRGALLHTPSNQYTPKSSSKTRLIHLPTFLKLIGFSFLLVALARPQSASSWTDNKTEGIDIVIGLDVSTSMLAMDLKPDRLGAAKELAVEFIEERPNDRIGLVVFAGESFTQCPLTTDHDVLKNLFSGVKSGIIEDGTAIGSGLATSINRLKESTSKSKVIILLTDGSNTVKSIPPSTAAEIAEKFDIRIYTIGLGSNDMAPYPMKTFGGATVIQPIKVQIDEKTLTQIAELSGGKYFRATSNKKLKEIYTEIDTLEKTKFKVNEYRKKHEAFLPWALVGFLSFLLAFLLDFTYLRRIV